MIKLINETFKSTRQEIQKEYPKSMFLMKIEKPLDDEGYLVAVSDNADEYAEFMEIYHDLNDSDLENFYVVSGSYGLADITSNFEIKQ